MQKVISRYSDANFHSTFRNLYIKWKFGKPKHKYYVHNRKSKDKILDYYDKYILDNIQPGVTIAFDCAGYYLDGIVDNLIVVDLDPIVKVWYPNAVIYDNNHAVTHLYNTADNFIVNNTIKLRWKTFDEFSEFWKTSRQFLRHESQIFFSFRDIFIFHNRLKFKFSDLLSNWLCEMQQYGFDVNQYTYDKLPVTEHMTDLEKIPEIEDMNNGNVKIHWTYRCR